jgi:hypothetical protein
MIIIIGMISASALFDIGELQAKNEENGVDSNLI